MQTSRVLCEAQWELMRTDGQKWSSHKLGATRTQSPLPSIEPDFSFSIMMLYCCPDNQHINGSQWNIRKALGSREGHYYQGIWGWATAAVTLLSLEKHLGNVSSFTWGLPLWKLIPILQITIKLLPQNNHCLAACLQLFSLRQHQGCHDLTKPMFIHHLHQQVCKTLQRAPVSTMRNKETIS